MAQATMTYIISNIRHCIPKELLGLAFKPVEFSTTIEQRIISEIIEGPVLLDANLVGGKRKDIILQGSWEIDFPYQEGDAIGNGVQNSFYLIPSEAREDRNIASVVGIATQVGSLPGSIANMNGVGGFGNNIPGMLSEMLNTRTFAQYPVMPQLSLMGTNLISVSPRQTIQGCAVTVYLEYDSEFLNLNNSAIVALCDFALCATKRYIATKLRVSIDETEVVAGMEIGVIKDLVTEYAQAAEQYHELLIRLKGAMHYDAKARSRLIKYMI